jgi:hypothetical protein
MKLSTLASLLIVALLAFSAPDAWAKKKKGKQKPKPELTDTTIPQPGAKPDYSEAAATLAPYVANADELLALQRSGSAPLLAFLDKAPGQLAVAKHEFTALRKAAEADDQAEFDAAIAACDVLVKSLEERQKTLGDINASMAVKGSSKLESGPRKDTLSQGIKGGHIGKAVATIAEAKREKAEKAAANKGAAQTDDAMTAGSFNRWNQRAAELKKYITAAYARIP